MIDTDVTPVTRQVEADIAAAEVPFFVVDSGILDVNDYSDVREAAVIVVEVRSPGMPSTR